MMRSSGTGFEGPKDTSAIRLEVLTAGFCNRKMSKGLSAEFHPWDTS